MARPRNTPVVSGVYFLFRDGELDYVGRSHDCYNRIAGHRQKGREFDLATVMPLAGEFIGRVEEALIRAYRPQRNRMVLEAKAILAAAAATQRAPEPAPLPPPEEKYPGAPYPDQFGMLSMQKCKRLAIAMGVLSRVIDDAAASGEIAFVTNGRITGSGLHRFARFDEVEAYLEGKRAIRMREIEAMFSPLPTMEAGR